MLAHYIRNMARSGLSAALQLSATTFVLDRWHAKNHTACLNPSHYYYTPEVAIAQYPDLAHHKTEWNECWNTWVGHFAPQGRHMSTTTLQVFILHIADLWNIRIASKHEPPRVPGPRVSVLKRRRPASSSLHSDAQNSFT